MTRPAAKYSNQLVIMNFIRDRKVFKIDCNAFLMTFVRTRAFISALTDNLNSVCLRLSFTHSFPTYRTYNTPLPPIVMDKVIDLRSKCRHFRILVIGRANSGKTTLLKKVCNSVEDPEIFDPSGKKVRGSYYLRTRRVHYLIPTRSITARSHRSAGVIRGTNHNPTQVYSRLLFTAWSARHR